MNAHDNAKGMGQATKEQTQGDVIQGTATMGGNQMMFWCLVENDGSHGIITDMNAKFIKSMLGHEG